MEFLQLLPKPAIKGELRRCQLRDHLLGVFRLERHPGDLPLWGLRDPDALSGDPQPSSRPLVLCAARPRKLLIEAPPRFSFLWQDRCHKRQARHALFLLSRLVALCSIPFVARKPGDLYLTRQYARMFLNLLYSLYQSIVIKT